MKRTRGSGVCFSDKRKAAEWHSHTLNTDHEVFFCRHGSNHVCWRKHIHTCAGTQSTYTRHVLESAWWLFDDGRRENEDDISCEMRYLKNCCCCWWWFEPVWCRDSTASSAHRHTEKHFKKTRCVASSTCLLSNGMIFNSMIDFIQWEYSIFGIKRVCVALCTF